MTYCAPEKLFSKMNAPQTPEISKHQKFHIQAIIDETNNDRKATEVTTKDCPVCEKSHCMGDYQISLAHLLSIAVKQSSGRNCVRDVLQVF